MDSKPARDIQSFRLTWLENETLSQKSSKSGLLPHDGKVESSLKRLLPWLVPERAGKTMLLKAPNALVTGHRKIRQELGCKLAPCWSVHNVPEGAVRASGGRTGIQTLVPLWALQDTLLISQT